MPRYNYHCEECEEYFEVIHSMSGTLEECVLCDSPEVSRVMCIPNYITKVTKAGSTKAGALVEEYIKKNKESIREEKKKLKNQEYKNE